MRTLAATIAGIVVSAGPHIVSAEPTCEVRGSPCSIAQLQAKNTAKSRPFRVQKFRFDGGNAVTGWELQERWYFGRYKGGSSQIALVRDNGSSQYSIGHKGISLNMQF